MRLRGGEINNGMSFLYNDLLKIHDAFINHKLETCLKTINYKSNDYNYNESSDFIHSFIVKIEKIDAETFEELDANIEIYNSPVFYNDIKTNQEEECKSIFMKFTDLKNIIRISIKPFSLTSNGLNRPYSSPIEMYRDIDNNNCFVEVDIDNKEIELENNYDELLLTYKEFFENELSELEKKKEGEMIQIDLESYRSNFNEFLDLSGDETQYIIPVFDKVDNYKSVALKIIDDKDNINSYRYMEIQLSNLSKEENNSSIEKLKKEDIILPNNVKLCSIILGDNQDENIDVLKRITSDSTIKCYIGENIDGDKVRIKRIIYGIDRVLNDRVVNKKLIDIICENDILSHYNKKDMNSYIPNEEYINYLKDTYPKLKDNVPQLQAIDKIMQMENNNVPVMLLQGPPGTGKTELILALARELSKANKNTLISSNVHVACNNVRDRLKNQKEIILKRYTSFGKNEDNKYLNEIIENQLRYLRNQVLAGYEYNGNTIDSIEAYDNLSECYDDYQNRIKQMDKKYTEESKFFENYNKVKEKHDTLGKEIEDNKKRILANEKKANELNHTLENISKELLSISKQIDESREMVNKISLKKSELDSEKELYSNRKIELDENITQLDNEIKENKEFKKNSESNRNSILELIDNNKDDFNYIDQVDLNKEFNHLKSSLKSRKKLNTRFFNYFEHNDYTSAINTLKTLQEDTNYWLKSKNISIKTLLKIKYNKELFYLKSIENYSNIYNKVEYLCNYYNLSLFKKLKIKLFNLRVNEISKEKIISFTDEINQYFAIFKNNLELLSTKIFDDNYNNTKYYEIKNQLNQLHIDSTNNLVEFDNKISKLDEEISNQEKTYQTLKDKLSNLIEHMRENEQKIKANQKEYNDTLNNIKELVSEKENTENSKAKTEKEINSILEQNKEIENNNIVLNEEKDKLKVSIDTFIDMYGNKLKEYSNFEKKYKRDRKDLLSKCDEINTFKESFNNKLKSLTNDSKEKNKYSQLLFDYAHELKEINNINIKEIDASTKLISKFIDGKGHAFKNEFKLDTQGSYNLISMTTNQITQLLKTDDNLEFDYEIIDEASKCSFEDIIISLPRVKNLILIGDYMQLNKLYDKYDDLPLEQQLTIQTEENWNKLNEATFSMLFKQIVEYNEKNNIISYDKNISISVLSGQYRMNKGIFNIISPIYNIHKGLEIEDRKEVESNDVKCININGREEKIGKSYINDEEINMIIDILKQFNDNRSLYSNIKTIGVITGYSAQVNYIRMKLKEKIKGLEIGTFDRFQGKEFDLVIVSLVRTGDVKPPSIGFLKDVRRMNVAFSRSKNHLIILGNFDKIMNISNKSIMDSNASPSESEQEENKYVLNTLIPNLNKIKEVYPSNETKLNAIDEFLKEDDYE